MCFGVILFLYFSLKNLNLFRACYTRTLFTSWCLICGYVCVCFTVHFFTFFFSWNKTVSFHIFIRKTLLQLITLYYIHYMFPFQIKWHFSQNIYIIIGYPFFCSLISFFSLSVHFFSYCGIFLAKKKEIFYVLCINQRTRIYNETSST